MAPTNEPIPPRGEAKIGLDAAVAVPAWERRCRPRGEQDAAVAAGQGGQLRHLGEAEAVGVGRIDAAHERIDEALVDLVAEPGPDELADRVGLGGRTR